VESMSRHSDEGHASFVSDSPPLGDTDVIPVHAQTETTVFTHSETLLTDTDKTVLADNTRTTKNGSHTHLPQARPESRLSPMCSALPVTDFQRVYQWVVTQANASHQTPPISAFQTISQTQTDVSTMPLGYDASQAWPHQSSKVPQTRRTTLWNPCLDILTRDMRALCQIAHL